MLQVLRQGLISGQSKQWSGQMRQNKITRRSFHRVVTSRRYVGAVGTVIWTEYGSLYTNSDDPFPPRCTERHSENWRSAFRGAKTLRFIHHHVQNSPPPAANLSKLNPLHPPDPIFPRAILIASSHLRLGLPSGLFPSGFATNVTQI
jgi:hypothetical protein